MRIFGNGLLRHFQPLAICLNKTDVLKTSRFLIADVAPPENYVPASTNQQVREPIGIPVTNERCRIPTGINGAQFILKQLTTHELRLIHLSMIGKPE